ncbi:MAG: hypothetical protein IAF02_18480 [Anaerolineae bacterium]|nr:hypothetical protein [Anaerolineae bacterium]
MKATLEQNSGENSDSIPYFVALEIVTETVDAGTVFNIPVTVELSSKGKQYSIDICGYTRKDNDINALPNIAGQLVNQLISIARLPSYVFIARRAREIYPVYTKGHEVFATTPGGPAFEHVELAKVREYLTDYLHDIGTLGKDGLSDKLHVRGVNMHTLGLRRPVFYLKKRVPGQVDFWAPVFESGDGQRIYTYAASARREVPIGGGQEVLALQSLVAENLQKNGRLSNLSDLRPGRLFPDYWERLKATLTPQGNITVNGIDMPLFSNDTLWVGEEMREEEDRISLYIGSDADDIQQRAAIDFERRGAGVLVPA